jgi:hypothetical protein
VLAELAELVDSRSASIEEPADGERSFALTCRHA